MKIGLFGPTANGGQHRKGSRLRFGEILTINHLLGGVFVLLLLLLKGTFGSGLQQATTLSTPGNAFESSIVRGRYALTLSLAENGAFTFSRPIAEFAAPDVAYLGQGKFASMFPPGIGVLAVPFYVVGRMANAGQLVTMSLPLLLTVLNVFLLFRVCRAFGFDQAVSALTGLIVTLGTAVLPYSTQLVQHQVALAVVLGMMRVSLLPQTIRRRILLWGIASASVVFDWPNAVLVLPFLLLDIRNMVVRHGKFSLQTMLRDILFLFSAVGVPLTGFAIYNSIANGNPFQIGQFAPSVTQFPNPFSWLWALLFSHIGAAFQFTRIPFGLWVLGGSTERGVLFFAPVMLLSLLGIMSLWRKYPIVVTAQITSIALTLGLYSSFGDVWGGAAFGPRYLIPVFGLAAPFLASALHTWRKTRWFTGILSVTLLWSVGINMLGAVTTVLLPGAEDLATGGLGSTLLPAWEVLATGQMGSFLYRLGLQYIVPGIGFYGFMLVLALGLIVPVWLAVFTDK